MRRTASILALLTTLALAPAAAAKGPHAAVESGPEGIRPGQPWVTTLTLNEYDSRDAVAAKPSVVLRSRSARFVVMLAPLDLDRYRLRVVFPRAGRWTYTVLDGTRANRRYRFPAATIGRGADRVTTGYVAFAEGSHAEVQGGGGPIVTPDVPEGPGDALPPEVVLPEEENDSDGGGLALWIPAVGLALAGAGTLTVLRTRRR